MPDEDTSASLRDGMANAKGGGQRPDDGVEDDESDDNGTLKEERRQRYMYVTDPQNAELKRAYETFTYRAGQEYDIWRPEKNRHFYPLLIELALEQVAEFDDIDDYLDVLDGVVDEDSLPER